MFRMKSRKVFFHENMRTKSKQCVLIIITVIFIQVIVYVAEKSIERTIQSSSTGSPSIQQEIPVSEPMSTAKPREDHTPYCNLPVFNQSVVHPHWPDLNIQQVKVIGRQRSRQNLLTIGIPSIKRPNGNEYLINTVSSIVKESTWTEKSNVVVLIYLADFDVVHNAKTIKSLFVNFSEYLESGFIQVVQAPKTFYPSFKGMKKTLGDEKGRVEKRAKQVIDYASMFLIARNMSKYYLQLEDDVVCAKSFLGGIVKFIKSQPRRWTVLEFSELGFIGKLFHSEDLQKLARYLLLFYKEEPVDWLLTYFRLSMAQNSVILRKPTLFQHKGKMSTIDQTKEDHPEDKYFETGDKPHNGDNPPAEVFTNIRFHQHYSPDLSYHSGSGFFWSKGVRVGDSVFIVFHESHKLHRVIIETGSPSNPGDILNYGTLWSGESLLRMDSRLKLVECGNMINLGDFVQGRLDANNLEAKLNGTTKCLKIQVTVSQETWIVFYQIAVFLSHVI